MTGDGHLLVTLGRANAIAVYLFQLAPEGRPTTSA